jgi:hypothetical protein
VVNLEQIEASFASGSCFAIRRDATNGSSFETTFSSAARGYIKAGIRRGGDSLNNLILMLGIDAELKKTRASKSV